MEVALGGGRQQRRFPVGKGVDQDEGKAGHGVLPVTEAAMLAAHAPTTRIAFGNPSTFLPLRARLAV